MGARLNGEPLLLVPDAPEDAHRAALLGPLAEFNRDHAHAGDARPLAVLLRNGEGATIGGLWGNTLFAWLNIELLFVPAALRRKSVGREILVRAEAIAAARGCIGACLDTYDFQAPAFYDKLGYTLVGTIKDCPPGGARHFFQKRFVDDIA
jgi:GNAT superfamily N-acetyltransferase